METGTKVSKEKKVKLSGVKPESKTVVRFAEDSFDHAIQNDLFFKVLKEPNAREGRIKLFSFATGQIIEKDDDRLVIEHPAKMVITP